MNTQTSARVGWNGGLGGWAERQCRGSWNLLLLFIRRNTRQAAIAPYGLDIVGCADEGGASFAIDGLRKLSPSYGPNPIFSRVGKCLFACPPFRRVAVGFRVGKR